MIAVLDKGKIIVGQMYRLTFIFIQQMPAFLKVQIKSLTRRILLFASEVLEKMKIDVKALKTKFSWLMLAWNQQVDDMTVF